MKMIWHKYIGQYIAIGRNIFSDFLQEIDIVFFCEKYGLFIISPIVNMVDVIFNKIHRQK